MSQKASKRTYGKSSKRTKAERMFAELPQSPMRPPRKAAAKDTVDTLAEKMSDITIKDTEKPQKPVRRGRKAKEISVIEPVESAEPAKPVEPTMAIHVDDEEQLQAQILQEAAKYEKAIYIKEDTKDTAQGSAPGTETAESDEGFSLRVLSWDDVCPPGDKIIKIAEASYAEVYRVTNERGTSIIKVIRLHSPIKAQTKAQVRSGLVDEEPHSEEDVKGELQISEWLADIPGFVVYKERYIVQGKATRALLDTHQSFQKKMKRQDPGRAQFYPSPSRYLDDTRFLVVELGDAGTALEDWEVADENQLWDIFFLEAIALARAEDLAMFEVCAENSYRLRLCH